MSLVFSGLSMVRAGYVLAREGVISALPADDLPAGGRMAHRLAGMIQRRRSRHSGRSARLSNALNRLGPSWVKLGQFLATRPDVVGQDVAGDLQLLQDRMEPFARTEAMHLVSQSLGVDTQTAFSEFGEPVAAASVAQVHRAVRRRDGDAVAVKVIRPGVRRRFQSDLDTFFDIARFQEKHIPQSRRLKPVAIVETLAQSAKVEMDLRLEAAAICEMAENIAGDTGFRVPAVDWELTGRDCLTLEWVDGIKLSKVDEIRQAGHDPVWLASTLVQSFLRQTLRDGFFHADMHPGNLFVDAQSNIVAVDFGITGRLGRKERRFLAEILFGFITRDYYRVAEVHFEAGYVPRHHSVAAFAQAIRAIGEPIHGQSAQTISMARLLTLLFEITDLFDMQTRPELLMLQKTMVVVEGVARTLDPDFNMWKTSEPVVGAYLRRQLGPAGLMEDAGRGLHALHGLARALPELSESARTLSEEMKSMAEGGLRLDPDTVKAIGKEAGSRNLWFRIGAILIALIALYLAFF